MKNFILLTLVGTILTGCGTPNPQPRNRTVYAPAPTASGPLANACIASDRTARSRALCGCVQAVANQTLTPSQQRRAVAFYSNPHQAQVIRQSDRAADEQFWKAYSAYGERARQVCK